MFKPCKLTVNGKKYIVNAQKIVGRIETDDSLAGYNEIVFCDSSESQMVLSEVKRIRHNRSRRQRHEALTSLGLVRVKGALGGVHYE